MAFKRQSNVVVFIDIDMSASTLKNLIEFRNYIESKSQSLSQLLSFFVVVVVIVEYFHPI